jgi:hypothetical protein
MVVLLTAFVIPEAAAEKHFIDNRVIVNEMSTKLIRVIRPLQNRTFSLRGGVIAGARVTYSGGD